jgi:hypothetical protein
MARIDYSSVNVVASPRRRPIEYCADILLGVIARQFPGARAYSPTLEITSEIRLADPPPAGSSSR